MKKLLSLMCSLLIIVTLCGCSSTQDQQEEVTLTLAAAASLENVFEDKLIPEFEKENPSIKVQGVYDSSGKLQIQIEQGLKADVFFSAATKQMDALVDEKYINDKDVVNLLENKLVLITGKQTTTEVKDFADIAKAETIAIGDPEVVPAGQYAKMALTHLGLYDALTSKYSLGGNVTEVLNWVASSSSEVGIVYSTDAKSSKDVKVLATCENSLLAEPVIYPVAKLAQTKHSDETEKFIKFIQKKSSLKQFENYQKNIRTIGLGITGLADTFAMLNMKYGSEESIKFTDELMNFISLNAYDTSCDLAKEKGSFNFLDKNKFVESNFIRKHIEKYPEWEKIKDKILFYGIRNGRLISVAPAGTLSLSYGNNCSSSLEPIFSLEYDRQIKIGGQDDENIEIFKMRDYVYEKWLEFNSEENIVDKNKFVTAMELSVDDHVNILSTVSYHVDMSCSKTINIPTEYSFEDTKDVYTKCWKNGISGCTIFRPNEIRKGILTIDNEKDNKEKEQLLRGEWEKRPESIIEIRRKIKSGCGSMTLHIGIIPTEKRIFDFYVTNSSKGGCALGIQNLAIAMSHDLRIGGNLKSLEKSFKGAGTCPSYVRAKGKGIEVSKGNSCGASILYCLLDVENDLQEEVLKELVDLNYYNHDKQKEVEENTLTKEDLDYIKEYGETAFASRYHKCPECGEELSTVGSCLQCKCGFSKC